MENWACNGAFWSLLQYCSISAYCDLRVGSGEQSPKRENRTPIWWCGLAFKKILTCLLYKIFLQLGLPTLTMSNRKQVLTPRLSEVRIEALSKKWQPCSCHPPQTLLFISGFYCFWVGSEDLESRWVIFLTVKQVNTGFEVLLLKPGFVVCKYAHNNCPCFRAGTGSKQESLQLRIPEKQMCSNQLIGFFLSYQWWPKFCVTNAHSCQLWIFVKSCPVYPISLE